MVGFSGHRQLADSAGVAAAIRTALESLRSEAPGEWIALASAAAGADLLFVRAALDLGMGWEASLPLPLVDFERNFSPTEWVEVKTLLARTEHLEVASEPGSRDEAYLTGGFEIVNRCDVLHVVWDGRVSKLQMMGVFVDRTIPKICQTVIGRFQGGWRRPPHTVASRGG